MNTNKGYFLVFLTAMISGFSIFLNQFGVKVINPYIFTGLKNMIVALFLTSLLFILKDRTALTRLKAKQWLMLILIGLVGGSIPFLLFFKGLALTTAAQGSFLHKIMFLYVAVLAGLFLKEEIDKKFIWGGLALLLGNFLLLKKLSWEINPGDLLVLLATLFWAVENTFSKYALKELNGTVVAWGRMFFGSFFILIFLGATAQLTPIASLNQEQIGWVILTSVLLLGYVATWYNGLRYIPISQATVILMLGSPITTFLTFAQKGQISLQDILASFLIILGIILVVGLKQIGNLFKGVKFFLSFQRRGLR